MTAGVELRLRVEMGGELSTRYGAQRKCWQGAVPAAIGGTSETCARREPFPG